MHCCLACGDLASHLSLCGNCLLHNNSVICKTEVPLLHQVHMKFPSILGHCEMGSNGLILPLWLDCVTEVNLNKELKKRSQHIHVHLYIEILGLYFVLL